MGDVIRKKVMLFASHDWSLRHGMRAFIDYYDPTLTWRGKEYKIELGRIIAEPIICGTNLREKADCIVDRTVHWNNYYKCWAQTAINCQMSILNHPNTFDNHGKHVTYDLMARCMHPDDYFPTTVLLPQFNPYTEDQRKEELWRLRQQLILEHTKYGWDPNRRRTDWDKVNDDMERYKSHMTRHKLVREQFYYPGNYLKHVIENIFKNQFPLYLKKVQGGGGHDVFKINSLEELYEKYDKTEGRTFHLQEAVEDFDVFIRCMAIGPQILPMKFLPDTPLHEHYSPDKLKVNRAVFQRLSHYVKLINAFFRWTYNSYECLVKDGCIMPIDFANACPDSNFTSLNVHFPWVICALVKWLSFCAIAEKDLRIDLDQKNYLDVFNDPNKSALEKYEHHCRLSDEYFEIPLFEEFCQENFQGLEEKMIEFVKRYLDEIVGLAIEFSDFPKHEHKKFFWEYKNMMKNIFLPNAEAYMTTVIYEDEDEQAKTAE